MVQSLPVKDIEDLCDKTEVESNYGSEFGTEDEHALALLLSQAESQHVGQLQIIPATVLESIEDGHVAKSPIAFDVPTALTDSRNKQLVDEGGIPFQVLAFEGPVRQASVEVEYDARNRVAFSRGSPFIAAKSIPQGATPVSSNPDGLVFAETEHQPEAEEADSHDSRSPLERFKKRKPLSVTNITSPAWCEIQYWYNLSKYGRVRRTKAMEQGSSVHKVMEEQTTTKLPVERVNNLVQRVLLEELKTVVSAEVVAKVVQEVLAKEKRPAVPVDVAAGLVHRVLEKEKAPPVPVGLVSESIHKALGEKMRIAVPVEVTTKEDAFGLRLWNIIQGIRSLRATGIAREIEVWGLVEGEVINGVIDELSYDCPDDELEAKTIEAKDRSQGGKRKRRSSIPQNQSLIQSYFSQGPSSTGDSSTSPWLGALHEQRKVYLSDIKTRTSRTVPSGEVSLRPTAMQLMMYHRLLSMLASNSVPAGQIFERYNVVGDVPLSDTFITQVGSLDLNLNGESVEDSGALVQEEQDAIDELLAHNTLEKLWTLMISEFARAMPFSSDSNIPSPIGNVLRAEYRASGSGSVLGTRTFAYDPPALDAYLKDVMAWWHGKRMPRGVDIDEAFKCRICEFADICSWRKEKVDQGLQKASRNRIRRQEREKSEV